jgi:hypothetical protein
MRTADMVKSKFWRGKDLKGAPAVVLTIAEVTEELMGRGTRQDVKAILWFNETLKGLRLNSTNVAVLEEAYGPDSDLWRGGRVRLSFDPTVMFGGERVGGVKVQTPAGIHYQAQANQGAWGAPQPAPASPAAPPVPVLNPQTGQWELPPQRPPATASAPPVPVLNPATGQWELPKAPHVPPATISQRVAAGHPPVDEGWATAATVDTATGEVLRAPAATEDFNDEIPF